ncbi:MAG: phosphoglucosamine mutase [Verrucomicrobia bacterium]|nr:phosphoglucosamine mutase [Verrucomicrobiota bacterium]
MAVRKLFGTDGIRGSANCHPVTPEIALRLGRAAGYLMRGKDEERPRFVIGRDTRRSGAMLESALISGLNSLGADVLLAGVIPTPAVACLVTELHAAGGIVISASHNPAGDNGLKLFGSDGYKLDDALEERLEALILTNEIDNERSLGEALGTTSIISDASRHYEAAARASVPGMSLHGLKIAVDCANGASFRTTPQVLKDLGATLSVFHAEPDGMNINRECGSTHPEEISRLVRETGAHIGISHDGDADRLLLCDERGEVLDGDELLAMTGLDALRRGTLAGKTLVATVMSNLGLDEVIAAGGGKVIRTAVGDRYVVEAMRAGNFSVGGEQSGHMIFRDHGTTGDGLIAALQIIRIMTESGKPLSELRRVLKKYPQAQRNLRVKEKPPIDSLNEVSSLVSQTESALAGKGRLLLRYSGTEPKVRLLIEGADEVMINQWADKIAAALTAAIGA